MAFCAKSFDDATPERVNLLGTFFASLSSAASTLYTWLSDHKLLYFATSGALIVAAIQPFFQNQFSFSDIFRSRLLFAAFPLPLVPLLSARIFSRVDLRFFQIDSGRPRRRFISPRAIGSSILSLLSCGALILIDPIGVYASKHTKAIMSVFYVTDRQPAAPPDATSFSSEPSAPMRLSYGKGVVPVRWSRRDVFRNLRSKVMLSAEPGEFGLQGLSPEAFYAEVDSAAEVSELHGVSVFVHGFHNSFHDAINTTARLSLDLRSRGADVLYSWPSKSEAAAYDRDGEKAQWSSEHLEQVLGRLGRLENATRLNLIAHSMGNRVLVQAIHLGARSGFPRSFDNVILAAADIDGTNFDQASGDLKTNARRVTIYVSGWDAALRLSSQLHQGPRVGFDPVCRDGMDVIDTQGLDTSLLGFYHGYLFDSDYVLGDLFNLTEHDDPPMHRIHLIQNDDHCTWRLQPR